MPERSSTPRSPRNPIGRLLAWWRVPTYRFAGSFLLYLGAIALAFPFLRIRLAALFYMANVVTAEIVHGLLSLFTSNTRIAGETIVSLAGFSVTIIEECTGIYEALILAAALLAYPTAWRHTLVGFALGIPMIYAMNVLRIAMLLVTGGYSQRWFDFMHLYFWQVTMIAMVATAWLAWLWWVVRDETDPAAVS
ncbi:MAG: exosortase H [Deltaproteobacteria bacterium]|nr:exosortase H [Deltaproteobacteria bacterium]MBW2363053.1 exosortase H [Deltaproteobacteria bacterium]